MKTKILAGYPRNEKLELFLNLLTNRYETLRPKLLSNKKRHVTQITKSRPSEKSDKTTRLGPTLRMWRPESESNRNWQLKQDNVCFVWTSFVNIKLCFDIMLILSSTFILHSCLWGIEIVIVSPTRHIACGNSRYFVLCPDINLQYCSTTGTNYTKKNRLRNRVPTYARIFHRWHKHIFFLPNIRNL